MLAPGHTSWYDAARLLSWSITNDSQAAAEILEPLPIDLRGLV